MTTVQILEDALAIVSHPGWWSRGAVCRHGSVCAMGAIGVVDGLIKPINTHGKLLDSYGSSARLFNLDTVAERVDPYDYGFAAGDPKAMAEYIIGEGTFPYEALTPEAREATVILAAALKELKPFENFDERLEALDFHDAQEDVVSFNDSASMTQDEIVSAFERALDKARTRR